MKPAPFAYTRPGSVEECVATLREAGGDGKILAGGQSLVPLLAMRLATPGVVVDVNRIPGLDTVRPDADGVTVGALVRHTKLAEQTEAPLLAEAARWIGHTAIRTRGSTGGSLAHADPSAELPVAAVALGATLGVVGPGGRREAAADDFFLGPLEPGLADDEMLVEVRFPAAEAWGFAELARRHGDFGLVTVVAARVRDAWRVVVGGIGGVPHRARESEGELNAGTLTRDRLARAAGAVVAGLRPTDDLHASAAYRLALAEELTTRALDQATAGRREGSPTHA